GVVAGNHSYRNCDVRDYSGVKQNPPTEESCFRRTAPSQNYGDCEFVVNRQQVGLAIFSNVAAEIGNLLQNVLHDALVELAQFAIDFNEVVVVFWTVTHQRVCSNQTAKSTPVNRTGWH